MIDEAIAQLRERVRGIEVALEQFSLRVSDSERDIQENVDDLKNSVGKLGDAVNALMISRSEQQGRAKVLAWIVGGSGAIGSLYGLRQLLDWIAGRPVH